MPRAGPPVPTSRQPRYSESSVREVSTVAVRTKRYLLRIAIDRRVQDAAALF